MYSEKTGQFIAGLRKEKNLTQKDLAEKLFVTDKAVSKWEQGLSLPDISILQPLADILSVSVSEILNGERAVNESAQAMVIVDNVLDYAKETRTKASKKILDICAFVYSVMLIIGILTCVICDFSISQSFTWSLIPISALVYAWLLFFPIIKFGTKGIFPSLILLSVSTIPFIYILDRLIYGDGQLMYIGSIMTAVSIVFVWAVYIVFRICKKRRFLAAGITCLAGIPLSFTINYVLSRFINEPFIDIWDIMSFGILLAISTVFFVLNNKIRT